MRRPAVSLVEVAVVVVILGILLALLLPALQSAREAGATKDAGSVVDRFASATRAPAGETTEEGASASFGLESKAVQPRFADDGLTKAGANVDASPIRKIVYRAQVELAVEDFSGISDRVLALIKQFDGYVADSTLTGSTGETRRGVWKIRVPVARFEEFVGAAKGLGELITAGTTSQDVSEEYFDVDARIRNKTKEEQRLLALLEERPGDLKDVIAIERELSRVREELERMQGRMRVLADLTSLTTVQLSITEIRGYEPAEMPTLATRARRAFEGSIDTLRSTGEGILVGAVALAPWLPVGLVLSWPILLTVRRAHRRITAKASPQRM